jgi:hypothetical protein
MIVENILLISIFDESEPVLLLQAQLKVSTQHIEAHA